MDPILLALCLIVFHNVDGAEVSVNPEHVTTLNPTSEADGKPNKLLTNGVKCVIGFDNGKFVSVIETCATVRQAINQAEKLK